MIVCKNCGRKNPTPVAVCPECAAEIEITQKEAEALLTTAKEAMRSARYVDAVELYRFLAEVGICEGEREFALILERGVLVPRDLDMAMQYFFSAAKKGDPLSAYRYSKLISMAHEAASDFWLGYAAIMGEKSAFSDALSMYDRLGDENTAAYYCYLLAKDGDIDAIVELARRHLYGKGVEQNESKAKWYMDKLSFPPIYAVKLSYRLRAVENAEEAEPPEFMNRDHILRFLINEARHHGLRRVVLLLSEVFAESAAPDAAVSLANLYIEGVDVPQDVERGIELLEKAKDAGSAIGAKCLGDLFAIGKYVPRDINRAIGYYKFASTLGNDGAYESIGDVFLDGVLTEPDPLFALSLFEKGAREGDKRCAQKAYDIKRLREKNYFSACEIEKSNPEEAFRLFKLSVDAGYLPAHAKIAPYYERGIGTKIDRKEAFRHYSVAVEAGDKRALYDLGRCYSNGIGTRFNFKAASEILSLAKELGQSDADRELFRIYENKKRHMLRSLYSTAMRLLYNRKCEEAKRLFEVGAGLGSPEATYSLGCLYEFGLGTPPDRRTALNYYKVAYAGGYSDYDQSHKQKILRVTKSLSTF